MENSVTLYSNTANYFNIIESISASFPKAKVKKEQEKEFSIARFSMKNGLFGKEKVLKIIYRERLEHSFKLDELAADCPLTQNLFGMTGFVTNLPSKSDEIKNKLIQKIQTLNCEFTILDELNAESEFVEIVTKLASDLDAIVYARPELLISESHVQHFLDRNLELILDVQGNNHIDELTIQIDAEHFDKPQNNVTEAQQKRKEQNQATVFLANINVNKNLPCIEDETQVTLRSVKEIKERIVALSITNLLAFHEITTDEALEMISKWNIESIFTTKELMFINHPTDDQRSHETWKCECIWTLMWAINVIPELEFPDRLAELNNIPTEDYPIGNTKNPNDFIERNFNLRTAAEILDTNDLYYRINWACVDARMKGEHFKEAHSGVVYERHYALNWLIQYRNQDWDDVSTDT